MHRMFAAFLFCLIAASAPAQEAAPDDSTVLTNPAVSGLEDILRRQQELQTNDDAARSGQVGSADAAQPMTDQLGTLGGASDADLWRAYRFNEADIRTQSRGPAATVLIQDNGMWWLDFRRGPLATYGAYLLGGTLVLLALFYLLRGRIRIDGQRTGRTVTRFKAVERFGHWLTAGSFVLLALTGLITLFGRMVMIPLFGHESFSILAIGSKWVHNNISWAFMIGLVLIFFMWVLENIPNRLDLKWLAMGGGLFKKGVHPPAKKFNAGQKIIFWSVILLGGSISVSGLSLLFPFELHMFGKTFGLMNATGLPELLGFGVLSTDLTPHAEMQYAQLWHAIVGFVLMAIILAHIYIGSVGMEGAFDAMGSGEVEEQWAREHHGLWLDEVKAKEGAGAAATPAE